MAIRPGVNGRQLRIGMLALIWALGIAVVAPPPGNAGSCGGLPATIDLEDQPGPLMIEGTSEDDVIHGSLGPDQIFGRGGRDTICGDTGADNIDGGSGNDTIYGMGVAGADDGDNTLIGGSGRDFLLGDVLNDTLRGGPGQDQLYGAAGIDTLFGNDDPPSPTAHDELDGGSDADDCFPNGADTIAGCP